jgi:hypothetical protein
MLVDVLKYNHSLGSKLSLFPMLANVAGMACVGVFVRSSRDTFTLTWSTITDRYDSRHDELLCHAAPWRVLDVPLFPIAQRCHVSVHRSPNLWQRTL